MFSKKWKRNRQHVKKGMILGLIGVCLSVGILGLGSADQSAGQVTNQYNSKNVIRFHVIANSDSKEDQLLKYAVRDEILKKVAPRLAQSKSMEESRKILLGMKDELVGIAGGVVKEWEKDYQVSLDYGVFPFPTKSYGNIVLPGGNYEAVRIKLGKAEGANWWCMLFPALCFVNVEESTKLPVDGKPGVPINTVTKKATKEENKSIKINNKEVSFFFGKLLK